MKPVLEIIITHCAEPWSVCEKMFKSLDIQRGMTPGACSVTVVQDGDAGALDEVRLMKEFSFVKKALLVPHGGVSAARNAGLDESAAEWVMFCDCDDLFYHAAAVRMILDAIEDAGDRADLIWGPVWIELRDNAGVWRKTLTEKNSIFIHGKIFRRAWLEEKGIRFAEGLDYSEDSLFCSVTDLEIDPARVGRIPEPIYMWCLRKGSCTESGRNAARNREHLMRHRIMMPEICERRGKEYAALTNACRGIFDAYHELCGGKIAADERARLEEMIARGLVIPWARALTETTVRDRLELMRISWQATRRKGEMAADGPDTPFEAWLAGLKDRYGGSEKT